MLSLVAEIAAISGVRDGHRNGKSQKSLRFRCAKTRIDPTLSIGTSIAGAIFADAVSETPEKGSTLRLKLR